MYKGKDSGNIIEATKNKDTNAAICFLDEADKKMMPSVDSNGTNNNAVAQGNLLVMLEGGMAEYGKDSKLFDTSHTMFILLGAFQELRDEKRVYGEMLDEISIDDDPAESNSEDQFYKDISIDEMVHFGMREELAGRIRTVVNFRKPDRESMKEIIRSKCDMLAKEYRCSACMTDKGVEDFMKTAYTSVGIRGVINTIAGMLIKKLSTNISSKEFDRERDILILEGTDRISVRRHTQKTEPLPF